MLIFCSFLDITACAYILVTRAWLRVNNSQSNITGTSNKGHYQSTDQGPQIFSTYASEDLILLAFIIMNKLVPAFVQEFASEYQFKTTY